MTPTQLSNIKALAEKANDLNANYSHWAAFKEAASPAAVDSLIAENERLRGLLSDAADDAEYYAQYAGEYLAAKHGIAERVAEYRAALGEVK